MMMPPAYSDVNCQDRASGDEGSTGEVDFAAQCDTPVKRAPLMMPVGFSDVRDQPIWPRLVTIFPAKDVQASDRSVDDDSLRPASWAL